MSIFVTPTLIFILFFFSSDCKYVTKQIISSRKKKPLLDFYSIVSSFRSFNYNILTYLGYKFLFTY